MQISFFQVFVHNIEKKIIYLWAEFDNIKYDYLKQK